MRRGCAASCIAGDAACVMPGPLVPDYSLHGFRLNSLSAASGFWFSAFVDTIGEVGNTPI